ncbi:TRAP transporter TatT component family protein [Salinispira pacifica]|uniref:Lipoprotein n=1 Tax=Salinispira pacifica TaxID=1307761 RepID=V5WHM8_9SPIO|nr:TRAP transporter TatT component family protein [Salinispira pacifica]AHC14676.1 hypothetical protein L21SP2_1275 [Salinispira pacifica]
MNMVSGRRNMLLTLLTAVTVLLLFSSCSIQQYAVNRISDALTGEGSSQVFMGDNDPALVGDALPFAIKMYETLLQQNPEHLELIETTGSLYIMYANGFIQTPAELSEPEEFESKFDAYSRAKNLYLRGRDMLGRALELRHPGILKAVESGEEVERYAAELEMQDVGLVYWYAAGWFAAASIDSFDMKIGFRLPAVLTLLNAVYRLDPDYSNGSIEELFISVYASLPQGMGGDVEKAEKAFARAVEIQQGSSAGPYVSLALSVALPAQDVERFIELMEKALEIPVEEYPENILLNTIQQRKARWYLDHLDDFFLL